MSNAPERIWADEDTWFTGPGRTERAIEYIRADVADAAIAKARAEAVQRFLSWRLPEDFAPDGGISFSGHGQHGPTGTNLFTAAQAEAMIRHILSGQSAPAVLSAEGSAEWEGPLTLDEKAMIDAAWEKHAEVTE